MRCNHPECLKCFVAVSDELEKLRKANTMMREHNVMELLKEVKQLRKANKNLMEFVNYCQNFKCETPLNYLFDELEFRTKRLLHELAAENTIMPGHKDWTERN